MVNAPLLWFRTSLVVYVPLLWFMYLCCGLYTSVGVCVPLLGFMYLLWGLYTCDREMVRGFMGWTEGSDTKSGGVGWGGGGVGAVNCLLQCLMTDLFPSSCAAVKTDCEVPTSSMMDVWRPSVLHTADSPALPAATYTLAAKALKRSERFGQNFFTFTLLPGSSGLLQTPECSDYHHSEQSPVVSSLSLTRLQLSGTNSLFLSAILLSALLNLP